MLKAGYHLFSKMGNRLANRFFAPVLLLIYHRVTELAFDPQLLTVSPENFRHQMMYLKKNFPVLRFEDDWHNVKKPSVVITFDDGYADNYHQALPILEEVGVAATFFICTGAIGSCCEFWWDDLERIILADRPYPASFTLFDSRHGRTWPTDTAARRLELYAQMHLLMRKLDAPARAACLGQLRQWAEVDETGRGSHLPLTGEELQNLARSPWVTIGAHTVTHTALSNLPAAKQEEEILGSKRQLEAWLARDIETFSYPFGSRKDYTRHSAIICGKVGFRKAAANSAGQVHGWSDPYRLPRQLVRNWPVSVFEQQLRGFLMS